MSVNDDRILALREKINNKRDALGPRFRFSPKTNCALAFGGKVFNIRTISREELVLLAAGLGALIIGSQHAGVGEPSISGYALSDWLDDIQSRLEILSRGEKERELSSLEDALERLLSEDKRTELKVAEIEDLLKD